MAGMNFNPTMPMLSNQIMAGGHAGFGGQLSNAMSQMLKVNQGNQQASLANSALGGGGGGAMRAAPQQMASPQAGGSRLANNGTFLSDSDMDHYSSLNRQRDRRHEDLQWMRNLMSDQFVGPFLSKAFGGGGFGMPGSYNTNFGASGSYSNPGVA